MWLRCFYVSLVFSNPQWSIPFETSQLSPWGAAPADSNLKQLPEKFAHQDSQDKNDLYVSCHFKLKTATFNDPFPTRYFVATDEPHIVGTPFVSTCCLFTFLTQKVISLTCRTDYILLSAWQTVAELSPNFDDNLQIDAFGWGRSQYIKMTVFEYR